MDKKQQALQAFNDVCNLIFAENGYKGHYNSEKFLIVVYDVRLRSEEVSRLKDIVEGVTKNFLWKVLHPLQDYSNIAILDIEL